MFRQLRMKIEYATARQIHVESRSALTWSDRCGQQIGKVMHHLETARDQCPKNGSSSSFCPYVLTK
jgi:hypothetical protein